MSRKYIFVDVETTGLDSTSDKLVELTYAYALDDVNFFFQTLYFGVTEVPEFIDNLIGFSNRGIAGWQSPQEEIDEFLEVSEGQTMVSANPPFDAGFLQANGLNRFHYRNLDIESYAAAKLGLDYVPGMKDIYDILISQGYQITKPMHTSESDVACLVECYFTLEQM